MTSREFKYHFKRRIFFYGQAKWIIPFIKNPYKRITKNERKTDRFQRWMKNNGVTLEYIDESNIKLTVYET